MTNGGHYNQSETSEPVKPVGQDLPMNQKKGKKEDSIALKAMMEDGGRTSYFGEYHALRTQGSTDIQTATTPSQKKPWGPLFGGIKKGSKGGKGKGKSAPLLGGDEYQITPTRRK